MKERPILFSAPMVRALLAGTKTQTRRVVKPQPHEDRLHRSVDSPDKFVCAGEHTWWSGNHTQSIYHSARCPYGQPGDRLWVRETWQVARETLDYETGGEYDVFEWPDELGDPRLHLNGDARFGMKAGLFYVADGEHKNPSVFYNLTGIDNKTILRPREITWRPSIHMPRWASRISLGITSVRVERLQDISIEDAKAEGAWGPDDSVVEKVANHFGIHHFDTNPRLAYQMLWEQINGPDSWDANPWVWVIEFKRITP